ncbi:endonuclease/exonuclease/phosphatase family protein [Brevundimonas goettingensis]|uniref:Endonuclease/exonuclease/phosphatase family protein n=1 Tax=Brevundimonas goettingensis TaxID=2774190 RepID=A0A975GZT2_9CAUL|nr:endonuclease/exonuclease/phosphatase family protein [Brevundimonas goettingensis]QTC92965.1 endonuclease/exonuclease/phosphatase family protein [Brevundimonas goettingensis]
MLNRRTLLTGMTAAPLASPTCACVTAPAPAGSGATLTLATFNIWHNQGDWPARLPLIVEVLRAQDADVIALEEVLQDAAVGLPNQAQTLAEALGYQWIFHSVDDEARPRRYGNAILTRLPIIASDWKKLEPLDDYRTAIRLRVAKGGAPIDLVVTHLAWQDDAGPVRARQIGDLLAWLPQDGTPLVVMGDFNATQEDSGLAVLTGPDYFSALPRGSVATTLKPAKGHPNRVIDHIFARADAFAPVSARAFATQSVGGEYASDHFGVSATIRLRQGQARR